MITYRGKNKHTIEELDEIIEQFQDEIISLKSNLRRERNDANELRDLVREIYHSAKDLQNDKENKLEKEEILINIIKYFKEFSKNYNFDLE